MQGIREGVCVLYSYVRLGPYNSSFCVFYFILKSEGLSGLGFSGPLLPFPHVAKGELMGPMHTETHTALKTEAHSYQDTVAPLCQAGLHAWSCSTNTSERRAPLHMHPCSPAHLHKATLGSVNPSRAEGSQLLTWALALPFSISFTQCRMHLN